MDNRQFAEHISECLGFDVTNKETFIDNCVGVTSFHGKNNLEECQKKVASLNAISEALGWGTTFGVYKEKSNELLRRGYCYMILDNNDEWLANLKPQYKPIKVA